MTQHPIATHLATSIRAATQPQLRDYQQDGYDKIHAAWDAGHSNVLAVYPTGAGKCLGKDTPVLMYDGSIKPVQNVVPGDLLMGPDSQPRGVISTCTGREMLYRITPIKGEPYVVNESHILSLKKTGTDEIVNISVKDYLTKSNNFKHLHKGWRVGVQYSPKRYSKYLPPYMLGVWLGDGTLRSASITSMDQEVVDYLYEYANNTDQTIRIDNVNTGKASTYHFSANNRRSDSLRAELKRYELLGNTKFIPHHYKTGSINQRLELLAGILDTDGHYDTKTYDIVFKQEQLAHDTAYVARSLGLAAYVKPCRKTATNTGATGTYFRISISGDFTDIPSKLNRNVFTPRLQKKSVLLTGINVEPVGEGDYYGFEITGDRLFMLGDFTVTHNTVLLSRIVFDHHGGSCVIAHRQELVSQISIALARNGVRHRIIGSENVIRNIVQLHMFEIGMSFYDPNAQCAVAGVDTLVRRMGTGNDGDEYYYKDKTGQLWYYPQREYGRWPSPSKIDKLLEGERAQRVKPKDIDPQIAKWAPNVSLWVTDECFPAGTMIDGKPIESIKVGDTVTAFNEETHEFEKKKVVRLFKNKAPLEMVRVETKTRHVLNCTKGHPFWTKRGWVNACDLTLTDEVLVNEVHTMSNGDIDDNGRSALPIQENRENILLEKMWLPTSTRESDVLERSETCNELLYLREGSEPKQVIDDSIYENGSSLLLNGMFGQISCPNIIRNNESDKQEVRIEKDDREQSHAESGISRKNATDTDRDGSSTKNTWWKWKGTDDSGNEIIRVVRSHGVFTTSNSKNGKLPTQVGLSSSLQNRLWKRVVDDSDRSRWELASINISSGTGCKKRESSQYVGLESVSILKSRNLKQSSECSFDGYVYNIEVEGLHTYVANGVVVHNCHHILRDNKWGKAITLFPNAKGLGVTATPERSDGAGLGRHADGVFDEMVVGPTMRDLIKRGYLTDYDIVVPPNNITLHDSDISKTTGDYKPQAIADAVEHSSLVGDDDGKRKVIGDIVTCYEKFAAGKLGVTFVPSIKIGEKVKAQFIAEGIPAELVTAETPDIERARILRKFKNRELMNLINVDLFGEGFDLPAIEVVSMARPTQSYGLYIQQFGRALRLMDGKKKALIIDHVGNVLGPRGHGLPDTPRQWTLDRRDKRSTTGASDAITLRRCSNVDCFKAYERYMTVCPHCGTPIPEPIARNEPEFVDGDLLMLDNATLARLRGEVEQVDRATQEIAEEYHAELQRRKCPQQYILGHVRKEVAKHEARKEAQNSMRDTFTVWAGYRRAEGRTDSEIYRQFYIMFGIDYMTAMTVDEARAIDLTCKMLDTLTS